MATVVDHNYQRSSSRRPPGPQSRDQSPRAPGYVPATDGQIIVLTNDRARPSVDPHLTTHFDPTRAATAPTPSLTSRPRSNTSRRRYPPSPWVEDELKGIAKVRCDPKIRPLTIENLHDVPCPGAIDQIPMLFCSDGSDVSDNSRFSSIFSGQQTSSDSSTSREGDSTSRAAHVGSTLRDSTSAAESVRARASDRPRPQRAERSATTPTQDVPHRQHMSCAASREGSGSPYARSRPASPAYVRSGYPTSPPGSPRAAAGQAASYFEQPSPRSPASSISDPASRPTTPTSPMPFSRASTLPSQGLPNNRSRPMSNLANEPLRFDYPTPPSSPLTRSRVNSVAVPYPEDHPLMMPSADAHIRPQMMRTATANNSRPPTRDSAEARPALTSRHTFAPADLPTLRNAAAGVPASPTTTSSSVASGSVRSQRTSRSLRSCLGHQKPEDYQGWYVLKADGRTFVCPSCLESELRGSKQHKYGYESHVRPTSQPRADAGVRCCFTDKWYCLAFKTITRRQQSSLDLMAAIARVDRDDDIDNCPGPNRSRTRDWIVPDLGRDSPSFSFTLCTRDIEKVDTLFPKLRRAFKTSHHSSTSTCTMAADTARFDRFGRMLEKAHEKASKPGSRPDLKPLDSLALALSQATPCPKDTFLKEHRWHFAPDLSEFSKSIYTSECPILPEDFLEIVLGNHTRV